MQIEIVTSTYQDEWKGAWINNLPKEIGGVPIKVTKYQKVDIDKFKWSDLLENRLPNFGRCDFSFLWHICDNYHNLADITIFTKINWEQSCNNFYGLLSACQQYKYVETGHPLKWQKISDVPFDSCGYEVEKRDFNDHPFEADTLFTWIKHLWPEYNKSYLAPVQGPCFSVTKDLILSNPLETYKYLLTRFDPASGSWNQTKALQLNVSCEQQIHEIALCYHDHFLRFYRVLFARNLNSKEYLHI